MEGLRLERHTAGVESARGRGDKSRLGGKRAVSPRDHRQVMADSLNANNLWRVAARLDSTRRGWREETRCEATRCDGRDGTGRGSDVCFAHPTPPRPVVGQRC